MRIQLALSLMLALDGSGFAQEFEAVSVKPNKSGASDSHSRTDKGLYTGTNINLLTFVMNAFQMKAYQVEGPDWLSTERYDITARFPAGLPTDRDALLAAFASMNRQMLVDRFKLAAHKSSKEFSVYGLTVAKSGIKFKPGPGGGSTNNSKDTHYEGVNTTMDRFAGFLSGNMDLPVIDMTGLKGAYNLKLDWTKAQPGNTANQPGAPAVVGLGLQEAVQDQLGLKLENRKAPLAIVVVDHIERVPTAN